MRRAFPLKRYVFGLIMLLLILGLAELMAFASTRVLRECFRPTDDSIAAFLAPDAYEKFLERDFDSELGWRPPADHTEERATCVGEPVRLTYDGDRQRIDPSAPERPIEIITVGNSFTHGDDADDAGTCPALLAKLTGQGVANYGVSGCGPAQAALRFAGIRYAIRLPANQEVENSPSVLMRLPRGGRWGNFSIDPLPAEGWRPPAGRPQGHSRVRKAIGTSTKRRHR
jgi:hypothetical protein